MFFLNVSVKLSVSLCKLFSLLVIGGRKCSYEPGTSCSCKLFCCNSYCLMCLLSK